MGAINEVWLGELENRLEEIEQELRQSRDNSTFLTQKIQLAKEADNYLGEDGRSRKYMKEKIIEDLNKQYNQNEIKIQELLGERGAIRGLVDVIKMH
ncbi:hypothetical protein M4D52_05315 [Paenibacillus lactis]|uniref:hypothetical protein n=1 Tax=Paenibacillus lactis TaxID=228574 RepID=UPI00203A733C|nr:hypothetical protein [Paenibacillus lactis]MCM3492859.1 hypothetical protein [Paenibacillus lactis]